MCVLGVRVSCVSAFFCRAACILVPISRHYAILFKARKSDLLLELGAGAGGNAGYPLAMATRNVCHVEDSDWQQTFQHYGMKMRECSSGCQ
jgi:hypothetical protein